MLTNTDESITEWEKVANNNEYIEFIKDASSTLGGSFSTIGKNNTLIGLLSNINIGDETNVIKSSNNVFKVKLINKDDFDENTFSSIADSLKLNMIASNKNQVFNHWLKSEKDKIEINDLRSKVF